MARLSAVVRAPLLLTVGLAACSGGGSDDPISPPAGADAAVDAGPPGDAADPDAAIAAPDARTDARPDAAAPTGADLSIAITGAPDPVAASSALTYHIEVTNDGLLDAANATPAPIRPPGSRWSPSCRPTARSSA